LKPYDVIRSHGTFPVDDSREEERKEEEQKVRIHYAVSHARSFEETRAATKGKRRDRVRLRGKVSVESRARRSLATTRLTISLASRVVKRNEDGGAHPKRGGEEREGAVAE